MDEVQSVMRPFNAIARSMRTPVLAGKPPFAFMVKLVYTMASEAIADKACLFKSDWMHAVIAQLARAPS